MLIRHTISYTMHIVTYFFKVNKMPTGTVKWFNYKHGYGFIIPEQGEQDIFVHITAIQNSGIKAVYEGQKVSYEVLFDESKGKDAAENISVLAEAIEA